MTLRRREPFILDLAKLQAAYQAREKRRAERQVALLCTGLLLFALASSWLIAEVLT